MNPSPQDIIDLRRRHKLTQNQLADSLYGIKRPRIADWEAGRRTCPSIVFWAMKLTWDHIDMWESEQ